VWVLIISQPTKLNVVCPLFSAIFCPLFSRIAELPEFDAAKFLTNDEDIAAYLTIVIEENDSALLAATLGDIARARGMTEIAKRSGLTREALYKALKPNAKPRFDTINRVCAALGVQLVAQPVNLH